MAQINLYALSYPSSIPYSIINVNPTKSSIHGLRLKNLTLFYVGGGHICPPTTYRQFSPDVLIRGGSKYIKNLSFVIAEHLKLVMGQKNFPTPRGSPSKSGG